jgi:hypothetical protein
VGEKPIMARLELPIPAAQSLKNCRLFTCIIPPYSEKLHEPD